MSARRLDFQAARAWLLGTLLLVGPLVVIYCYYRASYNHAKRLRIVDEGKFYRSGQLTANGFREAFRVHNIKTVINLQEEDRDPMIPNDWRGSLKVSESEVCREQGVVYIALDGGVLDQPGSDPGSRPQVLDRFLEIVDHPEKYPQPILIHCKAGLHRTGLLTAVYRMEYNGWGKGEAVRELRANGFGTFAATEGNEYLVRYILKFQKGVRNPLPVGGPK